MSSILIPVIVLSGISAIMAALLAVGRKAFYVEVDERTELITAALPGVNCGGCGFAGCSGYAAAVADGKARPNLCPPGGPAAAKKIGEILGIKVEVAKKRVALVACAGDTAHAPIRAVYQGVEDCAAAHATAGGPKKCLYGCLGLGTCVRACQFDALEITERGLALVFPDKCTGCGRCVSVCPRNIIRMVDAEAKVHVLCIQAEKTKVVKEACAVGCTGCKLCKKRSSRFIVDAAPARVDDTGSEDIPEDISFVCATGSIFDGRAGTLSEWIRNPARRQQFEREQQAWKESEKTKKAAARTTRESDGGAA